MKTSMLGFFVLFLTAYIPMVGLSQDRLFSISGKVFDDETNTPLPGVTFRVLGTPRGSVSGSDGAFRINLPPGEYTILVSSVGYNSETFSIALTESFERAIRLKPSPVQLQEVVVLADDPGIEIIRKTISNKRKWMDLIQTYEFDAYTKQVLQRDTSIASITESYTTGYWHKDDGLREVIRQRRQTENIPAARNFTAVGQILNFNEDEIRLGGYTFKGPTAPDALENYTYKLLRTYESRGMRIYELEIKPKSTIKPLFEGTISISDSAFAVMRVNVKPNEAFRFPFIEELGVNYQQQFSLFEDQFWMPVDISIAAEASVKFPGFSFPKFALEHRSVLYEYKINPTLTDSLFELRRITVDSAATIMDSTFWKENQVLPLTSVEETAYRSLDSTQTLERQFRPGGPLAVLNSIFESPAGNLQWRFNRVEGLYLGLRGSHDSLLTSQTFVEAEAGYGFSDRIFKWGITLTQRLFREPSVTVGLEVYRELQHRPDANFYGSFLISLGSILRKNDYRDYYLATGYQGFASVQPLRWFSAWLGYRSERERSILSTTDFSIFSRDLDYRINPSIRDGKLNSLNATLEFRGFRRFRPVSSSLARRDPPLRVEIEHSSPGLGSDFDFTRYSFVLAFQQPTFLSGLLFPPQLRVRFAGGTSDGVLPPQRLFDLESRYGGVAPFGVLRTSRVKEFSGDRYLSLSMEHNFRSMPFHWLGIRFLEKEQLEIILSGALARTWLSNRTHQELPSFVQPTNGWHKEVGIGISRIFGFLRADFTWRLGQPEGDRFFFSIAIADIF